MVLEYKKIIVARENGNEGNGDQSSSIASEETADTENFSETASIDSADMDTDLSVATKPSGASGPSLPPRSRIGTENSNNGQTTKVESNEGHRSTTPGRASTRRSSVSSNNPGDISDNWEIL